MWTTDEKIQDNASVRDSGQHGAWKACYPLDAIEAGYYLRHPGTDCH